VLQQDAIDQAADADAPLNTWRGLSKQHLVDCSFRSNRSEIAADHGLDSWYIKNYGCNGGLEIWTYNFMKLAGTIWDSDYGEYTSGRNGREGTCTHSDNEIAVRVDTWDRLGSSPQEIREGLEMMPLSTAMSVGDDLTFY